MTSNETTGTATEKTRRVLMLAHVIYTYYPSHVDVPHLQAISCREQRRFLYQFVNKISLKNLQSLVTYSTFPMALVNDDENTYVKNISSVVVAQRDLESVKPTSTESFTNEKHSANPDGPEVLPPITREQANRDQRRHELYLRFRPYILTGVAVVILGWWISATILKATRHRWYVVTLLS